LLPVQAEFDVLFDLEKCCLRLYNYPIKAFRDEIQMNSFTKESWHSKKFINFFTQIDQEVKIFEIIMETLNNLVITLKLKI